MRKNLTKILPRALLANCENSPKGLGVLDGIKLLFRFIQAGNSRLTKRVWQGVFFQDDRMVLTGSIWEDLRFYLTI